MWSFLRRAAFTASVGGVWYAATKSNPSQPLPHSGSTSRPAATGHLALIRAHPDLHVLNGLLSPGDFLIDANHVLLACGLQCLPYHRARLHQDREFLAGEIKSLEAEGYAEQAALARLRLCLLDARDGRFEDALEICDRLVTDRADDTNPRHFAAAICYMLGRPEEGARWFAGAPDLSRPDMFMMAVISTALGCAPWTVGGAAEKLTIVTAMSVVEMAMLSLYKDADLPERLQLLGLRAFLRHMVAGTMDGWQDAARSESSLGEEARYISGDVV